MRLWRQRRILLTLQREVALQPKALLQPSELQQPAVLQPGARQGGLRPARRGWLPGVAERQKLQWN
jgi:hypothetical protein